MYQHNEDLRVLNQPACAHLRSKGMYITGTMNPEAEDAEIGDGNCWCGETQNVLGPDDGLVERGRCVPGRKCFQGMI